MPERVKKRIVQDMNTAYFPTKTIVPSTQIVHDRSNLEIFRGCIRGCRFCQAGFCYRPIRAKSADVLCKQAIESLEDSGNSEITLASLSTSDYRELETLADGLLDYCEPRKINLSLPSLRADNFSRELMMRIQKVRKSGLTFAPEAGTQRLRDAINKNVTEEEILSTCATAFSGGWNSVKLYFMLGLPTETDEDVVGIAELVYKILQVWRENGSGKKRGLSINLATAYFVPKPFTPFQWAAQITPEEYLRRVHLLQANLHAKCVDYRYHESDLSRLEAVMARAIAVSDRCCSRRTGSGAGSTAGMSILTTRSGWKPSGVLGLTPIFIRRAALAQMNFCRGRPSTLALRQSFFCMNVKKHCARKQRRTAVRTATVVARGC